MLVLSFKNPDNDLGRDSYDKYYVPLEKIKYFNTLINDTPFFDQNVEKKSKTRMKNLLKYQEKMIIQQEAY